MKKIKYDRIRIRSLAQNHTFSFSRNNVIENNYLPENM
jgi:hypothetical protein